MPHWARISTAQVIFRSLQRDSTSLLRPDSFDASSAALIESPGAKAVATALARLCRAQGYADGDTLLLDELVAAARALAGVVCARLSALLASEFLAGHGETMFASPSAGYAAMNALFRGGDANADPKASGTSESPYTT